MQDNQDGSIGRTLFEILLLAAAYVATARLGQTLAIPPGNVTPVWIPSGIVLAAVLLRGPVIWPGIWLGAFAGNVWAYLDWENFSNLGIAFISGTVNGLGDTLGALLAGFLLRRYCDVEHLFDSASNVAKFVLYGAVLNSAVSACFGVSGMAAVGLLDWADYRYVWITWWVGDGVGVILMTPLLLTLPHWFRRGIFSGINWREFLAFVALLALITEMSLGIFRQPVLPLPLVMVLPVLLWGALRFNGHLAIVASVIVAGLAIAVTSAGEGPFASPELNESLIELQLFLCTVLITVLLQLSIASERKHLQRELQDVSDTYIKMFDLTMGGVIVTDRQGCIQSVNQTAESIFGYSQDELAGRNINFLLPARLRERHQAYIDDPESHRVSDIFSVGREVTGCHRDGHDIPLRVAVNPSLDREKSQYLVVIHDLSDIRQLQSSLDLQKQLFGLLVRSAFDALIVLRNNRVANVNDRFEKLFAYNGDELLGKSLKTKLFTTDLVFIEGQGQVVESEGIDKHGRRFPVQVQQKSLRVGDDTVKIISIHDLTASRRQEQALKQALAQARDANLAKSRFLSSMSHELRTPMNAIVGFAQLLEMGENSLSERQRESVREIRSAGNHLLEVIDDILDLARIEAGTCVVNCENVAVNTLVSDCVELIKEHAVKRGIKVFNHLTPERVHIVNADPFRLKQIILNLLSNAIKFNHADGTVSISAEPTTTERLRISVTDSGVGLSEHEQDLVFQPFERVTNGEGSAAKGTGIGLVIAKSLIEQMGGEIGLESYKYMGSTFWIELPLHKTVTGHRPLALAEALNPVAVDGASGKKILYVEDQPANVKLLEHLVEQLAIGRFLSANDGETGLRIAKEERPDLMILDINMPGLDGFSVLRLVREDPDLKAIPVIALSSSSAAEEVRDGLAAGFDAYLTKPVDLDELSQVLEEYLG
ncbi:MAG: MASE1 domain-containing protein [Ketobacteraceae bacterium]|nr:MASE1 domain-containing protein [Ketobacteraceae bacterium]